MIIENKEKMKLVHVGHSDDYPSLGSQLGISEEHVEKHYLSSHNEFYSKIDFDIGLAPLSKNINDYKRESS